MAEIVWTEEAERWLRDIHDYIASDNPVAAAKVIAGIFEKSQVLRRFPKIGHKYPMSLRAKSEFCFTGIIV